MAKSVVTKKKELDDLIKKFPIGIYNRKDFYSIKVLGYTHYRDIPVVKMKFVDNPNFGRSQWFLELKQTKIMLKGYKLQK